jgi:hypothetical protein
MYVLTLLIALGIVVAFGFLSRKPRSKVKKKQKSSTIPKVYPLKPRSQAQLRRVK